MRSSCHSRLSQGALSKPRRGGSCLCLLARSPGCVKLAGHPVRSVEPAFVRRVWNTMEDMHKPIRQERSVFGRTDNAEASAAAGGEGGSISQRGVGVSRTARFSLCPPHLLVIRIVFLVST